MGFRIVQHTGMFPASMVNGVIHVAEDVIPPIKLPSVYGTVNFEKQCNNVSNREIMCYLLSDKYEFIIWWNGAVTNYYRKNHCLLSYFKPGEVQLPDENYIKHRLYYGGLMQNGKYQQSSQGGQAYLYFSENGKIYLISENCQLIGSNVTPNTYYYHYRRTCDLPNSPFIYYDDGILKCNAFDKKFQVECEEVLNVESPTFLEGVL